MTEDPFLCEYDGLPMRRIFNEGTGECLWLASQSLLVGDDDEETGVVPRWQQVKTRTLAEFKKAPFHERTVLAAAMKPEIASSLFDDAEFLSICSDLSDASWCAAVDYVFAKPGDWGSAVLFPFLAKAFSSDCIVVCARHCVHRFPGANWSVKKSAAAVLYIEQVYNTAGLPTHFNELRQVVLPAESCSQAATQEQDADDDDQVEEDEKQQNQDAAAADDDVDEEKNEVEEDDEKQEDDCVIDLSIKPICEEIATGFVAETSMSFADMRTRLRSEVDRSTLPELPIYEPPKEFCAMPSLVAILKRQNSEAVYGLIEMFGVTVRCQGFGTKLFEHFAAFCRHNGAVYIHIVRKGPCMDSFFTRVGKNH